VLLALRAGEPNGSRWPWLIKRCCACCSALEAGATSASSCGRRGPDPPDTQPAGLGQRHSQSRGIALLEGRDRRAIRVSDRAEKLLRDRCTGIAWELSTAQTFSLSARLRLGQYREYGQRLPHLLDEAETRGDLYGATHVRCRSSEVWLSRDRPDRALEELRRAMEKWSPMEEWPRHGFHLQHYWFLAGQIENALYCGAGAQAWQLVTQYASVLRRSLLLRAQVLLMDWLYVRARSALAAAVASGPGKPQDARTFLREAEGDARRLEHIKVAQSPGMGRMVRAGWRPRKAEPQSPPSC